MLGAVFGGKFDIKAFLLEKAELHRGGRNEIQGKNVIRSIIRYIIVADIMSCPPPSDLSHERGRVGRGGVAGPGDELIRPHQDKAAAIGFASIAH